MDKYKLLYISLVILALVFFINYYYSEFKQEKIISNIHKDILENVSTENIIQDLIENQNEWVRKNFGGLNDSFNMSELTEYVEKQTDIISGLEN